MLLFISSGLSYPLCKLGGSCYHVSMNKNRTPDSQRYRVNAETGCWEYTMSVDKEGYGVFAAINRRKSLRAHRYFYEKYKGAIPEGLDIDHLCRNKRCVNPEHLEAVTRGTNISRGLRGKSWSMMFKEFYNDNENGGSSRWLVAPNVVEVFILGILKEENSRAYQKGIQEIKFKLYKELEKI